MGASVYRRGFRDRLSAGSPLVLDGATGTELERRGAPCSLPLWSARALVEDPALVERIHRAYVEAGAEIVTANTFRTQRRTLARGGLGERAAELTALAVALARRALGDTGFVAGSMPTLEDCWRPDLVPDDDVLAREHAEHAAHLADAGADLLLVETLNTIREARAAVFAARATGLPVWVSFSCDARAQLLSGEPLAAALEAVAPLAPDLVGVNCLPPAHVATALPVLAASQRCFGVYANLGPPVGDAGDARKHDEPPEAFAAHALDWIAAGARVVGGCCGTRPAHIAAIVRALAGAHHPAEHAR
jgi:S-methylmethionine-dependent homocysteine/selenocysteine methylase